MNSHLKQLQYSKIFFPYILIQAGLLVFFFHQDRGVRDYENCFNIYQENKYLKFSSLLHDYIQY
jgi:hypothetical protein